MCRFWSVLCLGLFIGYCAESSTEPTATVVNNIPSTSSDRILPKENTVPQADTATKVQTSGAVDHEDAVQTTTLSMLETSTASVVSLAEDAFLSATSADVKSISETFTLQPLHSSTNDTQQSSTNSPSFSGVSQNDTGRASSTNMTSSGKPTAATASVKLSTNVSSEGMSTSGEDADHTFDSSTVSNKASTHASPSEKASRNGAASSDTSKINTASEEIPGTNLSTVMTSTSSKPSSEAITDHMIPSNTSSNQPIISNRTMNNSLGGLDIITTAGVTNNGSSSSSISGNDKLAKLNAESTSTAQGSRELISSSTRGSVSKVPVSTTKAGGDFEEITTTIVYQEPTTTTVYTIGKQGNSEEDIGSGVSEFTSSEDTSPHLPEVEAPSEGHFMAGFIVVMVLVITLYLLYHNRQKIRVCMREWRSSSNKYGQQRPNSKDYQLLSDKGGDVVLTGLDRDVTTRNYIY